MGKRILVLLGHPKAKSFSGALAEAFVKGAKKSGAEVRYIKLSELDIDYLVLKGFGNLDKDLKKMREMIIWAEEIVVVYPTWWGNMPALLKGFFDKILAPGFAFSYYSNGLGWRKFLKGRSARIITVTGGPWILNHFIYGAPGIKSLKWAMFWFSGIWPVRVSEFSGIDMKFTSEKTRERWLKQVEKIGIRDGK